MNKYYLEKGDRVYATGVFLKWYHNTWIVENFEDDTYFNGKIVEDIENKPYIDYEETDK